MKAILIIFIFLSSLNLTFCQNLEDELYKNYLVAVRNAPSTYQYYLVIKFKDLNTGDTREICVDGSQLYSAVCYENDLDEINDYDKIDSIFVNNKNRYFEFKNPLAINQLLYDIYSISDFEKLQRKVNFKKLAKQIKKDKKIYPDHPFQMYAHALFNLGILTGENGCVGGFTLDYVDRENQY